jgi:hypothetical protein
MAGQVKSMWASTKRSNAPCAGDGGCFMATTARNVAGKGRCRDGGPIKSPWTSTKRSNARYAKEAACFRTTTVRNVTARGRDHGGGPIKSSGPVQRCRVPVVQRKRHVSERRLSGM